ncbi:hypothetical protein [Novosphingobium sp.]|uniref:hypothetical protein n=1 Tax=Novosphingobium sp. TaxID=1874826 RepID=UPI003D0BDC07
MIALSSIALDPASGLRRESPRPPELRNAAYDAGFDWDTLFYDCYRAGRYVVLQGPPFLNLLPALQASAPLKPSWFGGLRYVVRNKRGEIWCRHDGDMLTLSGPVGTYQLTIQPDQASLFAGRRVIHTLSKDNAPRWIRDWLQFYHAEHGADAALVYDNGSRLYSAADLQTELRAAFPAMVIHVVSWPFRYGPQGGLAGAVNGVEAPWDSDFCQTGSMAHARLRFLRDAKSVLNVDIDELVLSDKGRSIFEATEATRHGFIKFPGQWISGASPDPIDHEPCRHADFTHRALAETRECPPKWCVVPARHDPFGTSWSVHNLFGSRHNRAIDSEFSYRHMTAISNSWKENRGIAGQFDPADYREDPALVAAFARAGLASHN